MVNVRNWLRLSCSVVSISTTLQCPILGQTEDDRRFLATTTLLLYFLCFIGFLVEISQLTHRGCKRYFKDPDNYIQVVLYTLTVIFIYGFDNKCWCSTPWQWQIGAFAVFLSWLNFIFILKYMPCTAVPINMFLSICWTFLKLIHLLFVLIFAFGVPFYMVFVRTTSSEVSCLVTDYMHKTHDWAQVAPFNVCIMLFRQKPLYYVSMHHSTT